MYDPDTIANFCGITGCTTDIASAYLEMAQGNLDLAISLYFDNGSGVMNNQNNNSDNEMNEEEYSDCEEVEAGDINRILDSQEIYRPQHVDDHFHSFSIFGDGDNKENRLSKQFDLPEVLKGPYLLEVAREKALYIEPRKWVFLCLFDRTDFDGARINRDIFHDEIVIQIMSYNFIIVQQVVDNNYDMQSEGARLNDLYKPSSLPYFAIINPMTGGVKKELSKKHYSSAPSFIDFITDFLSPETINMLPSILPLSIETQTSNRVSPITPASIKPWEPPSTKPQSITTQSNKRIQPSSPSSSSPAKVSQPSSSSPVKVSQPSLYEDISIQPGPNACRIRLRLPSSVTTICVDKTATIHELVLYIQHNYPELNNIDLLTGNPPVSILDDKWLSLDEKKLNGSVVIVRQI